MSFTFPEKPMLIYPSLARQIGVEPALLLGLYHEAMERSGMTDERGRAELLLSRSQWLALADFWDEGRLRSVTEQLVELGLIEIAWGGAGNLRLKLAAAEQTPVPTRRPEPAPPREAGVRHIPVVDEPPAQGPRASARQPNLARQKGPAPTFGGSIGWRRHKDELEEIFEQAEQRNQKLQAMYIGWQPSDLFHQLLPRYAIPADFADGCIDEFVLYFLDKDRKETNWDQKFLAWVKREWVKKQTQDARDQRYQQERESGSTGAAKDENSRSDSREKRKRITAALMDIKNTDW
ncbi:DnaT-like ssDNA-binding domain-containing protein [Marinobacterium sp. YM272]|uniref:DnaT-like ssDNA-binding domain-containing protein n=1 Tax=Marinobacterium sp. YM272 TaxID=3421654 RepID=UPI003D7F3751